MPPFPRARRIARSQMRRPRFERTLVRCKVDERVDQLDGRPAQPENDQQLQRVLQGQRCVVHQRRQQRRSKETRGRSAQRTRRRPLRRRLVNERVLRWSVRGASRRIRALGRRDGRFVAGVGAREPGCARGLRGRSIGGLAHRRVSPEATSPELMIGLAFGANRSNRMNRTKLTNRPRGGGQFRPERPPRNAGRRKPCRQRSVSSDGGHREPRNAPTQSGRTIGMRRSGRKIPRRLAIAARGEQTSGAAHRPHTPPLFFPARAPSQPRRRLPSAFRRFRSPRSPS